MNDHIHLFSTETQHNNYINSQNYQEPHVALTLDDDIVHYNKELNYLKFTARENSTIKMDIYEHAYYQNEYSIMPQDVREYAIQGIYYNLQYSYDKINWINLPFTNTINLAAGETVYLKGNNPNGLYIEYNDGDIYGDLSLSFVMTGSMYAEGNILSLYVEDFMNNLDASNIKMDFLFYNCQALITAPELPATTLTTECYRSMFQRCTSLTIAPELPATTLAGSCYHEMFKDCTALTIAPELPAKTLANYCYGLMFNGCTSLVNAPELPATTLAAYCYREMFNGCTSLIEAPELPATTLTTECYYAMFYNCTNLTTAPEIAAATLAERCCQTMFYNCANLNYIKAMFITTPSNTYTRYWVSGVQTRSGTFVKNSAAQWNVTGTEGVPFNWTVETASE